MTPITPNEKIDKRFAKSSIDSCKGVFFSSTLGELQFKQRKLTSCIIEKMTPNSVSFPVPTTIPEPWPEISTEKDLDVPLRTSVPINAMQCLSPNAFPPPSPCVSSPSPRSHISTFFLAGRVSPVSADSSISNDIAEMSRMSAGIRSPTENVTRSPGKSVFARGVRG